MKKRKWFWIVFVLLAALLLFWMLGGTDDADETTPVFTVAEGPLTIGITASGSVQSRDKVVLRSELEGRNTILWVVEDGVTVKAGDLLVEFDAASLIEKRNDQEITANTAHGNLIIAEERLEVTKGDCDANQLERWRSRSTRRATSRRRSASARRTSRLRTRRCSAPPRSWSGAASSRRRAS